MRQKDLSSAMNQNYVSAMRINDQDCEDAQIDFLATHINRCCLGHETRYHGDGITLPRCAGFEKINMKCAEALELVHSILNIIAKHG